MLPDKKAGKRYTRNELLERGWTTEMIDSLLHPQQAKNKTFYRASEVLTANLAQRSRLSWNRIWPLWMPEPR